MQTKEITTKKSYYKKSKAKNPKLALQNINIVELLESSKKNRKNKKQKFWDYWQDHIEQRKISATSINFNKTCLKNN